ncbi:MAG: CHAT domain-containing protein [Bacteroidia bacterium]
MKNVYIGGLFLILTILIGGCKPYEKRGDRWIKEYKTTIPSSAEMDYEYYEDEYFEEMASIYSSKSYTYFTQLNYDSSLHHAIKNYAIVRNFELTSYYDEFLESVENVYQAAYQAESYEIAYRFLLKKLYLHDSYSVEYFMARLKLAEIALYFDNSKYLSKNISEVEDALKVDDLLEEEDKLVLKILLESIKLSASLKQTSNQQIADANQHLISLISRMPQWHHLTNECLLGVIKSSTYSNNISLARDVALYGLAHSSIHNTYHYYFLQQSAYLNTLIGNNEESVKQYKLLIQFLNKTENEQLNIDCQWELFHLYKTMSKYRLAFRQLKSLELFESSNSNMLYEIYLNQGQLYFDIGDNNKALEVYQKGLNYVEKSDDDEFLSSYWNNIGLSYLRMNEYERASFYLKKSSSFFNGNEEKLSIYYSNLGYIDFMLGKYLSALNYLDSAIMLFDLKESSDTLLRKTLVTNKSNLLHSIGNNQEAYSLMKELNLMNAPYDENESMNGYTLFARICFSLGEEKEGLEAIGHALKALEYHLNQVFKFKSEYERKKYLNLIRRHIYRLESLVVLHEICELNEKILNLKRTMSGLLLKSKSSMLEDLRGSEDNDVKQLLRNYEQLTSASKADSSSNFSELLVELESKIVELHVEHFPEKAYVSFNHMANLNNSAALIEFSRVPLNEGIDSIKDWKYYTFVSVRNQPCVEIIPLFKESEIKHFMNSSKPNNLYSTRGVTVTNTQPRMPLLDSLYSMIWQPILSKLGDYDTIYFIPDGILNLVSNRTVFDSKSENRNKELYQISDYKLLRNLNTPEINDLLLIGGIDYRFDTSNKKKNQTISEFSRSLGKNENSWNYLPGTMAEINNIDSLLSMPSIKVEKWSSTSASESQFKNLSGNSPEVIHIATHGFFFEHSNQIRNFQLEHDRNNASDPLSRSGLIFSGANYAWNHGENPFQSDDGILTAQEISNLDLSNTKIVILSACETGLGDIDGSEGVYGLQRAFKMAGVDLIIMSLWKVPDKETTEFMTDFYAKWVSGFSVREAFNSAQHAMSMKYPERPEAWAGFVLFE